MARQPNPRAAAQRATARRVRTRTTILPKSITEPSKQAAIDYGYRVINGQDPYPAQGTLEAKQLARLASNARHHKADPIFLEAFQQYFYHDDRPHTPDEEDEEYDVYDADEDEE